MNMGYRYLFTIVISFPSDIYPEVKLQDHVVVLFSVFFEPSILFFHTSYTNLYSHKLCTVVHFAHTLPSTYLFIFLIIVILIGMS